MNDHTHQLVRTVIGSALPFDTKMSCLAEMERTIEAEYVQGKTNVLPIGLMTADDLVS